MFDVEDGIFLDIKQNVSNASKIIDTFDTKYEGAHQENLFVLNEFHYNVPLKQTLTKTK